MSDPRIKRIEELIADYEAADKTMSEANVEAYFVARLFEILGWEQTPTVWNRQAYVRGAGYADVGLQIENRPVIFLEAKRFGKLRRPTTVVPTVVQIPLLEEDVILSSASRRAQKIDRTPDEKQAMRYARTKGIKWAILTNFERLILFDADEERIVLAFDSSQEYIDRFDDLKLLARDQVAKGSLEWYKGLRGKPDVDADFYEFLTDWRVRLAQDIYDHNRDPGSPLLNEVSGVDMDLLLQAVQRTLDRLIIIRYADDVGALLQHDVLESKLVAFLGMKAYAQQYEFQQDINRFYRSFYREHDTNIFAPGHICERVRISNDCLMGLVSDLSNISFRKFTSDILGNTYESYLGQKLKLVNGKIVPEVRKDIRKGEGIYYTPRYIVEYIVDHTLGRWLYGTANGKHDGEPLAERRTIADIADLQVLDPAMGSGSFLIYAFDVLADFYERENAHIEAENAAAWEKWSKERLQKGMFGKEGEMPVLQEPEPYYIEKILQEHLYGVDLDSEAVEIASVNLIMRAFDRLKNGTGKGHRKLPLILRQNLKGGDSLISGVRSPEDLEPFREDIIELIEKRAELRRLRGDEERAAKLIEIEELAAPVNAALNESLRKYFGDQLAAKRPFNWQVEFPEAFDLRHLEEKRGFTVVIGNPPYIRPHKLQDDYKTALWARYPTFVAKSDIYACFLHRGLELSKDQGMLSYIVSNTWLSLESFAKIRRYILDHSCIVFLSNPLSSVFPDATVETIVVGLKKEAEAKVREQHEIFYNEFHDDKVERVRLIPQHVYYSTHLNLFDLAWDAVSARILDKMNKSSKPLEEFVNFFYGLKTADDKLFLTYTPSTLEHKKLLRRSDFDRYSTEYRGEYVWYVPEQMRAHRKTARPGEPERFESPKIMVQDIGKRLVATLDQERYYVKDALLLLLKKGSKYSLEYLLALINSALLNYCYTRSFITLSVAKNALLSLPIYQINFSNPIEKVQHGRLVELAQRMLDLNKAKQKAEKAFAETLKGYEREYASLWDAYYDHSEYVKAGTALRPYIARQPLIDANEEGEVTGIQVDEELTKESLFIRAEISGAWRDVARLAITDEDFRLFLLFALRQFLEEKQRKKVWSRGKILGGVLRALKVPVLVPAKAELNIARIGELMAEFRAKCPSEALRLTELERTLQHTDSEIDERVYELYGITKDERQIIEENLR